MTTCTHKISIRTLGGLNILVNGKAVADVWHSGTVKALFCTLLSPLDLHFSWERIFHSLLDIPMTQSGKYWLQETFRVHLSDFMVSELGCNPFIEDQDGIVCNRRLVSIDAHDFYSNVTEGFTLLSHGSQDGALAKFHAAESLYRGSYLPGMSGKIIMHTRVALESLHQIAGGIKKPGAMDDMRQDRAIAAAHSSGSEPAAPVLRTGRQRCPHTTLTLGIAKRSRRASPQGIVMVE